VTSPGSSAADVITTSEKSDFESGWQARVVRCRSYSIERREREEEIVEVDGEAYLLPAVSLANNSMTFPVPTCSKSQPFKLIVVTSLPMEFVIVNIRMCQFQCNLLNKTFASGYASAMKINSPS
jgi:hypothetical protein